MRRVMVFLIDNKQLRTITKTGKKMNKLKNKISFIKKLFDSWSK